MTMFTVDDLARDLKVRNEDLLRELVTMGYDVEGPESPLETDDPAALRAELVSVLPQREVIEKRIKPTVIRRRVKKENLPEVQVRPEPTRPVHEPLARPVATDTSTTEAAEEPPARVAQGPARPPEPPRKPLKKGKKIQPARIIERPEKPPVTAEPLKEPQIAAPKPEPAQPREGQVRAQMQAEVTEPLAAGQSVPERTPEPITAEETSETLAPAHTDEKKGTEERFLRKKKKKEKRMQPAQIIGRVELKKEPIVKPAPPPEPLPAPVAKVARIQVVAEDEDSARVPFVPEVLTGEERRKKSKKKEKKPRETVEEVVVDDTKGVRRRKEVFLRADLYDDRQRFGRLRARGRKAKQVKTEITTPKAIKRRIKIPAPVSVGDLAHKMSVKSAEVIQHLLSLGVTASIHEGIDFDTAVIVASEFGFEAESSEQSETQLLPALIKDTEENLKSRPPVITVMGHVDHGKTSLLDFIRSTQVTAQEAGGITQHIGAYKVRLDKGELVFLDTPGHEAFTAMRARGAQVTDFVVLVVAADDGVKEQTREAINHARAAKVPIVVAVNKIDKPDADRDRVLRELSELDLIPEAWGGDTLVTYVSAKTGEGVNEFLEAILLQAELMELRSNPDKTATGTVIEARLDKGRGPVATVLVKDGTLRLGDPFVAGVHHGKVRAMLDHEGRSLTEGGPATPVEVHGFSGVPEAGEIFLVVDENRIARQIGLQRHQKLKQQEAALPGPMSMEDLLARMQEQEAKELNIIVKADVQGSVEALKEALLGITHEEVHVKVIHDSVGTVTESDVMLASASGAMIIGFNVRPGLKVSQLAEERQVDVRLYTVIYEAIEQVQKATENMLAPVEKETIQGRAEVRQTFTIPKAGTIAGCHVIYGKILRSNNVRLLRDDVPVYDGKISSMKRFKDDIKEALEGYECGIGLENYRDIKVGDIIEGYVIEKHAAKLS